MTSISPPCPFVNTLHLQTCVLIIIDYWGFGLHMPLKTFLFSIIQVHLHVEFFLVILSLIHQCTSVCYIMGCVSEMLQCHMEATQLANIYFHESYIISIWPALSVSEFGFCSYIRYCGLEASQNSLLSSQKCSLLYFSGLCCTYLYLFLPVQNTCN